MKSKAVCIAVTCGSLFAGMSPAVALSAGSGGGSGAFHPEHVIVRTKIDAAGRQGALADLDARAGVVAVEYASSLVPGLRCVRVPAGAVERAIEVFRADSSVAYAERDYEIRVSSQVMPWGVPAVHAPAVWPQGRGEGVVVAVLDTGFDFGNTDLPAPIASETFVPGETAQDGHSHGTHVTGTVLARDNDSGVVGVAPLAGIVAGKVIADSGVGYESWVAAGIDWAVQQGARVINMSIGGPDFDQGMQDSCDAALAQGTLVVAAAGNNNSSDLFYPADFSSVMAVAAIDAGLNRAWFSNFGPAISVCAPGVAVESVIPGGAVAAYSGTSMASPHVVGVAALLVGMYPSATPAQVREAIEATAADLGASGRDDLYGHGLVDVQAARDRLACIVSPAPSIDQQPPMSSCGGHLQHISMEASGAGALTYQWQVQDGPGGAWTALASTPTALGCGATVRATPEGAGGVDLSMTACTGGGSMQIRCVVSNACGSVTSGEVTVTVRECPGGSCAADFDGSGGTPDSADIDAYFIDWLAGAECADVDCGGGTPDVGDIDVFFAAWLAGGC